MKFLKITTIVILFLCINIFVGNAFAANPLTLKIDPATSLASSPFSVNVTIEDADNLGGFEFVVRYDPAVIKAGNASLGAFLGSTGRTTGTLGPAIDNNTGTIEFGGYSYDSTGSNLQGPDGNGTLATIKFTPVSVSTSDLDLTNVIVTDPSGTVQTVDTISDGTVNVTAITIPTLSEWGIIIFSIIMCAAAFYHLREKQTDVAAA